MWIEHIEIVIISIFLENTLVMHDSVNEFLFLKVN